MRENSWVDGRRALAAINLCPIRESSGGSKVHISAKETVRFAVTPHVSDGMIVLSGVLLGTDLRRIEVDF